MTQDIDLIIPMVFPQDPVWQAEFKKYRGGKDVTQHVRFRSWGTEELLVRCCMKYMPWVRYIHILIAGESQVQGWMKEMKNEESRIKDNLAHKPQGTGPVLRIVYHREFIPEEYLPCFSSPCFEMFLHRIPGLSECFIYANDDMFPLSPLKPDDFFRVSDPTLDGTGALHPCVLFSEKAYPNNPNVFRQKCMAQLNMIAKPFGKHYKNTYLKPPHSLAPIKKSACEEVWRQHGEEITMYLSPLTRTNRSYNHYIYMLQAYFDGQTVGHTPREVYVGPKTATARIAQIIAEQDAGIVCLNDNNGIKDWEKRAAVVREAIRRKLGITAREPTAKPSGTENQAYMKAFERNKAARVTVCIVHYNTPRLTQCAIQSLWKHTPGVEVIVFDNSDREPFPKMDNVEIIDNTRGQIIDFDKCLAQFPDKLPTKNRWASTKHCYTVQWLINKRRNPFILMDSDVLVRQDISLFWQREQAFVGQIKPHHSIYRVTVDRVLPMLCFVNVPMMKRSGVSYFNPQKMYALTSRRPDCAYDTGCWFLEDVIRHRLPYTDVDIDTYILHFGHGSWKEKDAEQWLEENRELYCP